jgi:hypothetical protein
VYVALNEKSPGAQELAKWEQHRTQFTPGNLKPGNPYEKREYPKMLYRAQHGPGGKWLTSMPAPPRYGYPNDDEWARAVQEAQRFTESCQCVVNSPEEERTKLDSGEGWRPSAPEAMEHRKALDSAIGEAAAERNWRDLNVSEKARAESAKAEEDHFGHLGEIPEKPLPPRRRKVTRKRKAGAKVA